MKKILFALIASAATLAGTSAYAADFGDDAGSGYVGAGVLGSRYKFDVPNAVSSSGNSGTKAVNLTPGDYPVEFRSLPGWLAIPPSLTITNQIGRASCRERV